MDIAALPGVILTFVLGVIGALTFVFIAKQEAFPEFRPFVDIQARQKDLDTKRIELEKTDADIKRWEQALIDTTDSGKQSGLSGALESAKGRRTVAAQEMSVIQQALDNVQRQMRLVGVFCYLVLGGAFAAIGSNFLKVEGLDESLSGLLKPMVIGATWTSFLTAMGFNFGKAGAEKQLAGIKDDVKAAIDTLKADVSDITSKAVAAAEKAPQTAQPVMAEETSKEVEKTIADASEKIAKKLELGQARVYSSFR